MSYKLRDPNRPLSAEHLELLSRSERIWLFAEQHRSALIIGVLLICLMAGALGTIFWLQHQNQKEALALEHRAAQLYLDRDLDDPDQSKANLEEAITLFQQIIDEFPRSSSAELSWYFLGNARVEQENYPKAIEAYEAYVSSFQDNPSLKGLVLQRLGSAHMFDGQRQKGLDAYSQVLNLAGALNKDQVMFELAKMEESEEHTEEALTYYKQLQDQYPASPFISEATMRIRILDATQELSEDAPASDSTQTTEEPLSEETKEDGQN